MGKFARWNLVVSRSTDVALRTFLAERDGGESNMSGFVEEAVNREVLRQTASAMRARNADMNEAEVARLVSEELSAIREEHWANARR